MKTRYEDLCAAQMDRLNEKLQTAYKDSEDPVNQRIETLNSRFNTISEYSYVCRSLFAVILLWNSYLKTAVGEVLCFMITLLLVSI